MNAARECGRKSRNSRRLFCYLKNVTYAVKKGDKKIVILEEKGTFYGIIQYECFIFCGVN